MQVFNEKSQKTDTFIPTFQKTPLKIKIEKIYFSRISGKALYLIVFSYSLMIRLKRGLID